jgi:hypothetical protein
VSSAAPVGRRRFAEAWAGWHRSWCALAGIFCALLGLSVGTYRISAEPKPPAVDSKAYVAARLFAKATGKELPSATSRTKEDERARRDFAARREVMAFAGLIAGLSASLLGIVAIFRRENVRMAMLSAGLGVAAVFFDIVLVILAIVLIGSILSVWTC